MTRKKNRNKLGSPSTTNKKAKVCLQLMLSFFSSICYHTLTKRSQQCTRAGRRNAQRTAKCYYFSLESLFCRHYLLVKLIESLKVSSKRHLRETTIAFHKLIDAREAAATVKA